MIRKKRSGRAILARPSLYPFRPHRHAGRRAGSSSRRCAGPLRCWRRVCRRSNDRSMPGSSVGRAVALSDRRRFESSPGHSIAQSGRAALAEGLSRVRVPLEYLPFQGSSHMSNTRWRGKGKDPMPAPIRPAPKPRDGQDTHRSRRTRRRIRMIAMRAAPTCRDGCPADRRTPALKGEEE